jgi:hypothetical protein
MSLQVQGAGYREAWGFNGHVETLAGAAAAFGFFFLDHLSINAEALLFGARQQGWDTFLGGCVFYPRWHFFRKGFFSLYMDAGAGVSMASRRLPEPEGTEFNFLILAGPGVTFRVSDSCLLTGCFRYLHVSNGSIVGTDRNPDIDSLGGQVGVLFPF